MHEMTIEQQRQAEQAKYVSCYKNPDYKMGELRHADAVEQLHALYAELKSEKLTSLLDVGCGRAEIVRTAVSIGYWPVRGLECVEYLCGGVVDQGEITCLPYENGQFDVVTCFDVMEHIPIDDTEISISELCRVANKAIIVSISNVRDSFGGGTLHINLRDYKEWEAILKKWWPGKVEWMSRTRISETWRLLKTI